SDCICKQENWRKDQPLLVVFIGTDFEIRVWETLLRIPLGKRSTYSDVASHIGKPKEARAVGAARARRRRHAPSAPQSDAIPFHSSSPAIACSASREASAAITGA